MEKSKYENSVPFTRAHIFPCRYRNLKNLPHWHKDHELVYVQTGTAEIMYNGNFHSISKDDIAFLHGEGIRSISAAPDSVLIVAKIDRDFLEEITANTQLCSPILTSNYAIDSVLYELTKELATDDHYSGIIADSIVTKLIAQIFRYEKTEEASPPLDGITQKYQKLLDLIASRYIDITFDEAANFMHFSRPYFSKFFNQHIGMTFTRYLNLIKVSHAVQSLTEGRMTITEISQACGFNTIRNFNRVFKTITGYSPNTFPIQEQAAYRLKESADIGFDPTLSCSEILPLQSE